MQKVKFAKRNFTPEGIHEFGKRKIQERDFGATLMTLKQLERGAKRALKRGVKVLGSNKADMYKAQVEAYQKRIAWYLD